MTLEQERAVFARLGHVEGMDTALLIEVTEIYQSLRTALAEAERERGGRIAPTMDELLSIYEEAFHGSEEDPGLTACRESGIRAVVEASGGRIAPENLNVKTEGELKA